MGPSSPRTRPASRPTTARIDSGSSATTPASRLGARSPTCDGDRRAVAILDEGTGINASWRLARDADRPICITYQGGVDLVDPVERPNVFRIAPTDHGTAFRLAEYLVPKGLKIGLVADDSAYGQEGAKALGESFAEPGGGRDLTHRSGGSRRPRPRGPRARRADATALLVWGQPTTIAGVLAAARSSGWDVPVYTPAAGEDPLVRQQLAHRPEWVDGLTFAAGRPTAEVGPGPFLAFQDKYETRFGVQLVGVKTPDGDEVVQPPDYAMYHDCVNVLAAAVQRAGDPEDRQALLDALNQVSVTGANGDQRGFNENSHEGVDDDVYFARFEGMTYAPVKDDPLSSTLAQIDQRR